MAGQTLGQFLLEWFRGAMRRLSKFWRTSRGALPAADQTLLQALPDTLLWAWEDAGARVGWLGTDRHNSQVFQSGTQGLADPIPAFQFRDWPTGKMCKLPVPETPFGLYLPYAKNVTDVCLRELAGLKVLRKLELSNTNLTGAGLKHLKGLWSLQTLDFGHTEVTDAGLKHLTGLKALQWLELTKTNITDAGLRELAELNALRFPSVR